MKDNNVGKLGKLGQSVWLDDIRYDLIAGIGADSDMSLQRLIEEYGLSGMTSNPSIFEKAIVSGSEYDSDIRSMTLDGKSAQTIYELLTERDVQMAADVFLPLYDETDAKDGYVSLEVNPHLAHDTESTIEQARSLWNSLDRPNVCIKVPATAEGLPALTQLISEGINVNSTLIFGIPRYRQVAQAYIEGIEQRLAMGKDVKHVASVASFFVSRIDNVIDPLLHTIIAEDSRNAGNARQINGKVAVASAASAYQSYKEIFTHERFANLAEKGARAQRILFASTATKNPDYSDIKYITELIGPDTVSTMPLETFHAFIDHGNPVARLEHEAENANGILQQLKELGIDINIITQQLEDDGIAKFNTSFDMLLEAL